MIQWYKKVVLENYANFNGRARRAEFWWYALANVVVAIIAMTLDSVLGTNIEPLPYGYVYIIYSLAVFLPGLAVGVRRLHDVGKSGWFYFIILVPIIGAIWLLVLFATEGQHGENQYGSDPKNENDEINQIGTNE